jgi:glutaredoxin
LQKWQKVSKENQQVPQLVYGGDESYERGGVKVWSWRESWKAGTSIV